MHISKIKDENGKDKEFVQKWPLKDFKLNWLMLTTGWDESAMHTTYIINGEPSPQQLLARFQPNSVMQGLLPLNQIDGLKKVLALKCTHVRGLFEILNEHRADTTII